MTSRDDLFDFKRDLTNLLNRYSLDAKTNTPDFILAEYVTDCLATWRIRRRDIEKYNTESPTDEQA